MSLDILSIMTITPIFTGIILLLMPQILPKDVASNFEKVTRNISMGIALGILLIATMLFFGMIGSIDWNAIMQGDYVLKNDQFSLISSIGVQWKVGADALSFPMIWLTALLIPISMLVEWDAKRGYLFHPLLLIINLNIFYYRLG